MISMPPKVSSVAPMSCAGNAGSVTSPATTIAFPPALRIAAAVSSAGAGSRSLTTTDAPCSPNNLAVAAPMPRPEPVMIAALPSSMPMICVSPLWSVWQRRHKCACHFDIAILINGLHFSGDACLAIGLVFLGDLAGAGDLVADACHAAESHAKFAQRARSHIVAKQLPHKAHNQHAVSNNAARADHFSKLGIGVQGIEIAGRACITHELQVCDRSFYQLRQGIAYLHIFIIAYGCSLETTCLFLSIGRHRLPPDLLFAHNNHGTGFQYSLTVLIRILRLGGDDIHRGAALALARFAIHHGHHARQCIAWIDRSQVFILLFAMQDTHHVDAQA